MGQVYINFHMCLCVCAERRAVRACAQPCRRKGGKCRLPSRQGMVLLLRLWLCAVAGMSFDAHLLCGCVPCNRPCIPTQVLRHLWCARPVR